MTSQPSVVRTTDDENDESTETDHEGSTLLHTIEKDLSVSYSGAKYSFGYGISSRFIWCRTSMDSPSSTTNHRTMIVVNSLRSVKLLPVTLPSMLSVDNERLSFQMRINSSPAINNAVVLFSKSCDIQSNFVPFLLIYKNTQTVLSRIPATMLQAISLAVHQIVRLLHWRSICVDTRRHL